MQIALFIAILFFHVRFVFSRVFLSVFLSLLSVQLLIAAQRRRNLRESVVVVTFHVARKGNQKGGLGCVCGVLLLCVMHLINLITVR